MPSSAQIRKLIKSKKKKKIEKKKEEIFSIPQTKKRTYAEVTKRNMKMKIGLVPIKEFLNFYDIDNSYERLFKILRIKYSYQIIDNYSRKSFFEMLDKRLPVHFSLNKDQIFKNLKLSNKYKTDMIKFMIAHENINSQDLEYQYYFSIFKKKPTKKEYLDFLNSAKLDLLFRNFIGPIGKTKKQLVDSLYLIGIDLLRESYFRMLSFLLIMDIKYLKLLLKIFDPKSNFFFNGFDTVKSDSDLKKFIDKNKYLKEIVDPNFNSLSLEKIKEKLKNINISTYNSIYNHLDPIEDDTSHYLIFKIFSLPDIDIKNISSGKARIFLTKLNNIIFPNKSLRYLTNTLSLVENIPNHLNIDLRKKKMRVFFVTGHGETYSPNYYKTLQRLRYDRLYENISKNISTDLTKENFSRNTKFFFTQSYGRLTNQDIVDIFIDLYINGHGDKICKSLLNAKKKDINKINEFISLVRYKIKNKDNYIDFQDFEESYLDFLKNNTSKNFDNNIVDFIKYSHKNGPPNVRISFDTWQQGASIKGIYELSNLNYESLAILLDVSKLNSTDDKLKMGIGPDYSDAKFDHIFKYNKELLSNPKYSYKYMYIDTITELIYSKADIKNDENIVLIFNHCRGAMQYKHHIWDTIKTLDIVHKEEAKVLRELSAARSYNN